MQTAFLLIALGFGFKIFSEAFSAHSKIVRKLGQAVGAIMMIVSLVGAFCTVWYAVTCGPYGSPFCPLGGKQMHQGFDPRMGMAGSAKKMCPLPPGHDTTSGKEGESLSPEDFMKYHSFMANPEEAAPKDKK